MKRFVALVAVLLALGLLLAACSSDDDLADQDGEGHMGGGHDKSSDVADDARRIEVTATSFKFNPDEIRVDAGENIAIVLTSTDILHDFTIDGLDAHVAAKRGETEEGGFTANEPRRYTYYCSVAGHRDAGMEGTIVVE